MANIYVLVYEEYIDFELTYFHVESAHTNREDAKAAAFEQMQENLCAHGFSSDGEDKWKAMEGGDIYRIEEVKLQ